MMDKSKTFWGSNLLLLLTACAPKASYQFRSKDLVVHDSITLSKWLWNHYRQTYAMLSPKEQKTDGFLFAPNRLFNGRRFEEEGVRDSMGYYKYSTNYPVLKNYAYSIIIDELFDRDRVRRSIYIPARKELNVYNIGLHYTLRIAEEGPFYGDSYKEVQTKIRKDLPHVITHIQKTKTGRWNLKTKVYIQVNRRKNKF